MSTTEAPICAPVYDRVYGDTNRAVVLCPTCGAAVEVKPWIERSRNGMPNLIARVGTSSVVPAHPVRVPGMRPVFAEGVLVDSGFRTGSAPSGEHWVMGAMTPDELEAAFAEILDGADGVPVGDL